MHNRNQIQTHDRNQAPGDRHSLALQVFGSFMNTVRQGNQIQTMVNRYH